MKEIYIIESGKVNLSGLFTGEIETTLEQLTKVNFNSITNSEVGQLMNSVIYLELPTTAENSELTKRCLNNEQLFDIVIKKKDEISFYRYMKASNLGITFNAIKLYFTQ